MNRFIHVTAIISVLFQTMLRISFNPIVALNEVHASQFHGYVMRLTLSSDSNLALEGPANFRAIMIRSRHLYLLCMMILRADSEMSNGGDNAIVLQINLDIEIAPVLNEPRRHYEPLFNDFFSDDLVEDPLLPLEMHVREMKVSVHGHIESDMAEAFCYETVNLEWTSTKKALQYITVSREIRLEAWKAEQHMRAFQVRNEGSFAALRMHRGNSWPSLEIQSGEGFVENLAELCFLTTLNMIQYALKLCSVLLSKAESLDIGMSLGAEVIIRAGYWKDGHTFRPSDADIAKFRY
ncbi:hypothetical protein SNOG_01169 [Parastagonospora nodorum SN15]|uniref:Uncharacterized protein n=1 Tax=Phaeosphaeria nodorum (strain SN15 / ATCC MYA-4574 / FGSC 10173) TaxID=321614 RepID=Q0V495_PHANO|nr:hypothetical protein SNOG_01169 [Parastagonospora nodorum SN15]EAT90818.2 hypothetical protein SNOG_01169 [Parastagonospora nodorum SN15]